MIPQWVTDLIVLAPWFVAIAVVLIAAVKLWPYGRKLMHFIDDVAGEPARPGIPARPGLMERVARIEHEITPNHGGSMNDALRRVEAAQTDHRAENDEKFAAISNRLDELAEADDQLREDFDNTLNPLEDQ